jgi:lipoprotein-anchoring transpeptidase ErfK/SrfK
VETPIGQWRLLVKLWSETMAGTVNGEPYRVDDVPHVMYFTNEGHALHGTYWHANFGTPMSHGCVNLPLDVASWMYSWAPEGTAVTVIP